MKFNFLILTIATIIKMSFGLPMMSKNNNSSTLLALETEEEIRAYEWLRDLENIFNAEMPIISKLYWYSDLDDDIGLNNIDSQLRAEQFIDRYVKETESLVQKLMKARWRLFTNMNDINKKAFENLTMLSATYSKVKMAELSEFKWREFKSQKLRRAFLRAITLLGDSGLSDPIKLYNWKKIKNDMNRIYATAKIKIDNESIPLEPNISFIFQKNRDYDFLSHVWKAWRDSSGKNFGKMYSSFISLSNEATKIYGFNDYGEYSRLSFESTDLSEKFDEIYAKFEKLYRLLHSYVKKKLSETIYAENLSSLMGVMPAHILGDVWAQQWHNLFEELKPYKNKTLLDVTPKMLAKNLTVKDLYEISEEFFVSLGLDQMPNDFWNNSVFIKPNDGREINCHASAWDFYDGKDFRIKMCASVSMNDLFVIHHEMGHIHYYMNYKHQPFHFKEGANPGFHEALGDVMTLSVMTPSHLYKIDLIDELDQNEETDINFLMFSAMRNIAFAPFALTVEKWRWSVYSGKTTPENYNTEWWKLRCKYQGLVPPVDRDSNDFDPGAKYHIAASVPYDRYFVSLILTFQFHEALCRVSGHVGPLHKCDIYGSKEAGKKLREMMQKGSSMPWPDILYELTGTKSIDPQPMLDYFEPLHKWLLNQNLTDQDWDCDSFFNKEENTVKSYKKRLIELSTSSSKKISILLLSLIIMLNLNVVILMV